MAAVLHLSNKAVLNKIVVWLSVKVDLCFDLINVSVEKANSQM